MNFVGNISRRTALRGLGTAVALPLFDETGDSRRQAESDSSILGAVEKTVANGTNVVLQIIVFPEDYRFPVTRLQWSRKAL